MVSQLTKRSYASEFKVLDQALDDPRGVRIPYDSKGEALNYRLRLHRARREDRHENKSIYPVGNELHGKSIYDPLLVKLKDEDGKWYLYIVPSTVGKIEPLSEIEEAVEEPVKIGRRF